MLPQNKRILRECMSYLPGLVCCYWGHNMASHGIIIYYYMDCFVLIRVFSLPAHIFPRAVRPEGKCGLAGRIRGSMQNDPCHNVFIP